MQLKDFYSTRYKTIYLLAAGLLISFSVEVCMSVACVKMAEELDWEESQKGYILSAFYWGYAPGQMLSSYAASRVGAKWMFGLSILLPSVMSIALPVIILWSYEAGLVMRGFLGLCASGTFSSLFYFYPEWIPLGEKTILIALLSAGICIGEIISFSLSGYLAEHRIMLGDLNVGGWAASFVWFGLLGVMWFPFFMYYVYPTPLDHPTISKAELAIIYKGKEGYEYLCEGDHDEEAEVNRPLLSGGGAGAAAGGGEEEVHSTAARSSAKGAGTSLAQSTGVNSSRTASRHLSSDASAGASLRSRSASPHDPRASMTADTTAVDSRNRGQITPVNFSEVPWGKFFRHPAALTLLFNTCCGGWVSFMLMSEIPTYLTEELGFDLEAAGALSIVPYFANFVSSLLFGSLFDYLQNRKEDGDGWFSGKPYTVREIRQLSQFLGFGGGSLVLLATSFITDQALAYCMMVFALFILGSVIGGVACGYLDIAPRYSSVYNAAGNTLSAAAGFISPIFVSACLTALPRKIAWKAVFGLTVVLCWTALLFWHYYQSSDVIPELNTPVLKKDDDDFKRSGSSKFVDEDVKK